MLQPHEEMMQIHRSLGPFALVILALLAFACDRGGTETRPTPTPMPTPTPQPPVSAPFLDLTADATLGDILARVPEDERACVRDRLDSEEYEALQDQPAFGNGGGTFLRAGPDPSCFSNETLIGLAVAGISHQTGGLSTGTVRCIEGTFTGVDLEGFRRDGEADDPPPDEATQGLGALVSLLLCLTEEEASRVDLQEAPRGQGPSMTLQDVRCVLQRVDPGVFIDWIGSVDGREGSAPPEAAAEQPAQLMDALAACGVDPSGRE